MNKILTYRCLLIGVVLLTVFAAAACTNRVTPYQAPADVEQIQLERADSRNVIVDQIWLERKAGPLAVCGYVSKRLRGDDTTRTRLEVSLFDSGGVVLRRTEGGFSPQRLVRHMNHPALGSYHIELGELPAGTIRILVRARDAAD